MKAAVLTASELEQRLSSEFPEAFSPEGLSILSVWHRGSRVRLPFQDRSLRPGGTISGPTIMMLAESRCTWLSSHRSGGSRSQ